MRGILRQVKRVKARATSLAHLILELGQLEAKRKAAALGKAAVFALSAGVLAFYALGFMLAAAAAGLNQTLSLWLSLLIVAVALLLVAAGLALFAVRFARAASPPAPSQAVDEARRTADTLKTHA
ncbi:MAG TPA: phage holin family protein [Gaiellales bacterium]|jgi:heme/copper-type cytochrome/quinol oxidase subunit 2|nr:phage holin family protein [Gaiellales bacterium]